MTVRVERIVQARPDAVWQAWLDVEGSPRWDTDVRTSRLAGEFAVGTRGEFQLTSGLRVPFEITSVEPGRGYANVARFAPGLYLLFTHELSPHGSGATRIVHGARFMGPLGRLLGGLLSRPLAGALARALARLGALLERAACAEEEEPVHKASRAA